MRKLIREPFVHFLILGAAIFAAYHFVSARAHDQPGRIVITQGDIASMVIGFSRTWQRPATREELDGLIRDRVREEVYYREAVAMGLDRDDPIIRRRLQQKLQFVTEDVAVPPPPTDAELSEYLNTHPDAFRLDQRLSFMQLYFDPARHGVNLAHDIDAVATQLRGQEVSDLTALGDTLLLEHEFQSAPTSEIGKQFGDKFVAQLLSLPVGRWAGPIESGYGSHLVFVQQRTDGRLPELGEIREAVLRECANACRLDSNEKYFQSLLKRYDIVIQRPDPAITEQKIVSAK